MFLFSSKSLGAAAARCICSRLPSAPGHDDCVSALVRVRWRPQLLRRHQISARIMSYVKETGTAGRESHTDNRSASLVVDSVDEVRCRRAGPNDQRAVMNILDDIYGGADYLDFAYPFYMTKPTIRCYLAETKERVVGFVYCYVVDGGERVVLGAGRTSPELENKGISTKVLKWAMSDLVADKLVTPTCLTIFTAFDSPKQQNRLANNNNLFQLLSQRSLQDFTVPLGDIQKRLGRSSDTRRAQKPDPSAVRWASLEEFTDVFLCKLAIQKFFPDGTMICFWDPFLTDLMNVKEIHSEFLVQMSGAGRGRLCDAISFVIGVPTKAGFRYDIEFYGTSPEQLRQHVVGALEWLAKGYSFTDPELMVHLCLYFPSSFGAEEVLADLGKSMGCQMGPWCSPHGKHWNYLLATAGPILAQTAPPGTPHALKPRL